VAGGQADVLLVSPERLKTRRSVTRYCPSEPVGACVTDEAHCISDWGTTSGPDYAGCGPCWRPAARSRSWPRRHRERAGDADVAEQSVLRETAGAGAGRWPDSLRWP